MLQGVRNWKLGYVDIHTCVDGKDFHEWESKTMREDGVDYPIVHCKRCGLWG